MNEFIFEFLKISLGVAVGGVASAPFKALRLYNSTQIAIVTLEQKIDDLNQNLTMFNRLIHDAQVKYEVLELSINAFDRRLSRLETIVEASQFKD